MEGALRDELRLEYRSLSYYVPREDKPLMQFQLRAAERSALLAALRSRPAATPRSLPHVCGAPPPAAGRGALASCTSYDQLLDAARDTIYAPVLRHLRPSRDGALPDFTLAEAALRTAYFSHLYRIVHRQYTGRTQKVLLRALGSRSTCSTSSMCSASKPTSPDGAGDLSARSLPLSLPPQPRLHPRSLRRPRRGRRLRPAAGLPYRDCFDGVAVGAVEEYYQRAICRFNKRQLAAVPPPFTPPWRTWSSRSWS
ncbi:V-type ATPase subunit [Flavonifractor plautii]|nr:V-type ATPase subunit [Flavonifractor plautii]